MGHKLDISAPLTSKIIMKLTKLLDSSPGDKRTENTPSPADPEKHKILQIVNDSENRLDSDSAFSTTILCIECEVI